MDPETLQELVAELSNIGSWLGWIATWLCWIFIVHVCK